jgi:hypothetical protein
MGECSSIKDYSKYSERKECKECKKYKHYNLISTECIANYVVTHYRGSGNIESESWYGNYHLCSEVEHGFIYRHHHRLNGPAKIGYYESGAIRCLWWFVNDKRHRVDGPAWVDYHPNSILESCHWIVNDKSHRLDGPASIWYNLDGTLSNKGYYINDKNYREDEYWAKINAMKQESSDTPNIS